jgi:hypothetical protein
MTVLFGRRIAFAGCQRVTAFIRRPARSIQRVLYAAIEATAGRLPLRSLLGGRFADNYYLNNITSRWLKVCDRSVQIVILTAFA